MKFVTVINILFHIALIALMTGAYIAKDTNGILFYGIILIASNLIDIKRSY